MATFRILDARSAEDRAAWVGAWSVWPGREATAHPTYVELLDFRGDVVERLPNVVRELSGSEVELWKYYAHKFEKT